MLTLLVLLRLVERGKEVVVVENAAGDAAGVDGDAVVLLGRVVRMAKEQRRW